MTIATLEVTHYETHVYLGWADEERAQTQKIALDITLRYTQLPRACISDELSDTQCYAQLIAWSEAVCQSKPFKLIEHLAYDLHATLTHQLSHLSVNVFVRVHKLHPPVSFLKCASFSVGDQ